MHAYGVGMFQLTSFDPSTFSEPERAELDQEIATAAVNSPKQVHRSRHADPGGEQFHLVVTPGTTGSPGSVKRGLNETREWPFLIHYFYRVSCEVQMRYRKRYHLCAPQISAFVNAREFVEHLRRAHVHGHASKLVRLSKDGIATVRHIFAPPRPSYGTGAAHRNGRRGDKTYGFTSLQPYSRMRT